MSTTDPLLEGSRYEIVDKDNRRNLRIRGDRGLTMGYMLLNAPNRLADMYAAGMLSFLLFNHKPKDVAIIGLGGGQQAKYIYHRMPDTRVVSVEVDPVIVHIARTYFSVPPDDERFSVVVGDGGEYIGSHAESFDAILADGYDSDACIPGSMSGDDFYRACMRALRPGGVVALNLLSIDMAWHNAQLRKFTSVFSSFLMLVPEGGNSVVLGFKGPLPQIDGEALVKHARALETYFQISLPEFAQQIAKAAAGKPGRPSEA